MKKRNEILSTEITINIKTCGSYLLSMARLKMDELRIPYAIKTNHITGSETINLRLSKFEGSRRTYANGRAIARHLENLLIRLSLS